MPSQKRQGMPVAEFAREMGVRPQSVRDRVKSGRLAEAVLPDGSLDAVKARVAWYANSNPNKARPRHVDVDKTPALKRDAEAAQNSEYDLKVKRLAVDLETAEINLDKLRQTTIPRDDARRAVRALMRLHRNTILNFASRYGSEIASEIGCDERALIGALESRLRTALNEAANERLPFDMESEEPDEIEGRDDG